jgi:hypothetical protein
MWNLDQFFLTILLFIFLTEKDEGKKFFMKFLTNSIGGNESKGENEYFFDKVKARQEISWHKNGMSLSIFFIADHHQLDLESTQFN